MDVLQNVYYQRLEKIRELMRQYKVDALIVPSADPHLSEYLPDYWQSRVWMSGFTGSMGTLVILKDSAYLWADSRYWVQANQQLTDTGIQLKKIEANSPFFGQYLAENLPKNSCVAIDGCVLCVSDKQMLEQLFLQKQIVLKTDLDLVGMIWHDRPSLPTDLIYAHPQEFVDQNILQKLKTVRDAMSQYQADYHLISSLDDIAWLTNLRGSDVDFNPVFLAHLLIDKQNAILFVDKNKLNHELCSMLNSAGIQVLPYENLDECIGQLTGKLLIDAQKVAFGSIKNLSPSVELIYATNPSTFLKSIKSEMQIEHIREAMRQDGAALCEFFVKLEEKLSEKSLVNELDVDVWLTQARAKQPNYVSNSFSTIAGFQANGAIVHYRATKDGYSQIDGDGLLLIDSGAQYYNGTTDITRMVGVGCVSDEQKRDVTYVLKAHIALATASFPEGLPAGKLDVLARNQLWQQGLDYGHGTGHGVGYFLNVHEGPQSISPSALTAERAMRTGMITSNEPGVYREGKWGVRLENCILAIKDKQTAFGTFLKFESLTLCPFDTRLLLPELLTQAEKDWLNAYHLKVHDALIDKVSGSAKDWLIQRTQPID